jgi:tetratricopeptide (TPR) repeat protein
MEKAQGSRNEGRLPNTFSLAIDADPNFVLAYIGMAKAHDDVLVGSREDWEIRRKAAEKALALDPNSSEALGILANLQWEKDFDWSGAEQEYRQAIALDPNNAKVREDFCTLLAEMGRLEEAWRECQIAQELDPGNAHLPFILYWRGEYDRAIAMLRTMIERHPNDGGMHFLLFQCYTQKASHKDSIEELEKTLALYGLTEAANKIQRAFEMSGYRAALQELANELERLQATRKFFAPVNLADIYAILGERDRAFFWLEQAYTYREQVSTGEPVDYVMVDPMLDPLRSDPRFKSLRRRIGLPYLVASRALQSAAPFPPPRHPDGQGKPEPYQPLFVRVLHF